MPSVPLAEKARTKLLSAYIGDVRAWKADDPQETLIIAVKDPEKDADDVSFYALPRGQGSQLIYLGTTTRGKDGGCQPVVYNDGLVGVLLTEAPEPGQSGSLADLYLVILQYRLNGEPANAVGTVDQTARDQVKKLATDIANAAALSAK